MVWRRAWISFDDCGSSVSACVMSCGIEAEAEEDKKQWEASAEDNAAEIKEWKQQVAKKSGEVQDALNAQEETNNKYSTLQHELKELQTARDNTVMERDSLKNELAAAETGRQGVAEQLADKVAAHDSLVTELGTLKVPPRPPPPWVREAVTPFLGRWTTRR